MNNTLLKNNYVSITYHKATEYQPAYIALADLNCINWTSGYTERPKGMRTKQYAEKVDMAWKFFNQLWNNEDLKDDLNFKDLRDILEEKIGVSVHTYLALD